MTRSYERYKEIPLGLIVKKDLRMRHLSQKSLAHAIGMSYRKLNRVLNGHSLFSKDQAASIDNFFAYEESFTYRLQIYTKKNIRSKREAPIKKNLTDQKNPYITNLADKKDLIYSDPKIPLIRPCVFWDTDMQSLDWIRHRKFIEQRISLHGNEEEKAAIAKYYTSLKSTLGI